MQKFILTIVSLFVLCISSVAQDMKRPESYNYTRGVEAFQNENYDEALEYLQKEVDENAENGYAFSWIAYIHLLSKEYGRAITAADKAIKYIPKKDKEYRVFALAARAEIFKSLEKYDEAQKDFDQAIKEGPTNEDVYEQRAQMYYEQGKYDMADADYRKMIQLNQGDVMGYMGLGRNMYVQNNIQMP